jgi:hypothetical protein
MGGDEEGPGSPDGERSLARNVLEGLGGDLLTRSVD